MSSGVFLFSGGQYGDKTMGRESCLYSDDGQDGSVVWLSRRGGFRDDHYGQVPWTVPWVRLRGEALLTKRRRRW